MKLRRSLATTAVALAATAACGGSDEPVATATSLEAITDADDGTDGGELNDDAAVSGPAPGAEPSPGDAAEEPIAEDDMFPDVIDATAEATGDTWTISATLSSPYDTPERYADAWRVVGPDGAVYGERILTHDHANEQPFTRSQSGIAIPDDVGAVVIEGRDLEFGWGGDTFELVLPR